MIDRFRSLRVEVHEPSSRLQRFRHTMESLVRSRLLGDDLLAPTHETSYDAALAQFVDCVIQGGKPSPDLWDGYRSLAIVAAAQESGRSGKAVAVQYPAYECFAAQ